MNTHVMTSWMKMRICARLLLLQARWDPARRQGLGLAFALEPWLAVCWGGDPKELLSARQRHLEYFNTHPIAAWLVVGIICRQEATAATLSGAPREALLAKMQSLKSGLGASLAGPYDSFFWGALRPVSALAGILTIQASLYLGSRYALAWAIATALSVYNIPAIAARLFGLTRGAAQGALAAAELSKLPVQSWISGLRRATIAAAVISFAVALGQLSGGDRLMPALIFVAGLILTWRGVSPLTQLGFAGLGGMAASAVGVWP